MARETDVAKLSCLSPFDQRGVCAFFIEDPMRVGVSAGVGPPRLRAPDRRSRQGPQTRSCEGVLTQAVELGYERRDIAALFEVLARNDDRLTQGA